MTQDSVRRPNAAPSAAGPGVLALAALAISGCAPPAASVPEPVSEEDLPALREELRLDPGDRSVQGHLAASLLEAGQCDEASRVAQNAAASPFDSWPTLVLGRCLEEAEQDEAALEVYRSYLATYDQGTGVPPVRGHALLVERRLTATRARELLAAGPSTPAPTSIVAVLPFRVRGDDELEPVARTLTERLSKDLSEIDGLEVVDPLLVRLVLEQFGSQGALGLDSAQAVALARTLGAGQVIQGTAYLDPAGLNRLATRVTSTEVQEGEGGRVQGSLEEIPRLEKELALETAGALGEVPSPEERTRILYRVPRDVPSLRAYGEGLDLQWMQEYQQAVSRFTDAVRLDPDFEDARRALEANAAAAVLEGDGGDNVLAARTTVSAALASARRPGGVVDPLRLAIRAGTSDVSATQGERITGVVAASGEDGAVGSIQNLDAPGLITPAQLTGLIRIIVVIPGG